MNIRFLVCIFMLCFLSSKAIFGSVDFSKRVREVNVVHLQAFEINDLDREARIQYNKFRSSIIVGTRITERLLIKDINYLYLIGIFKSVEAETVATENGIVLNFNLTPNPKINNIRLNGFTQFNRSKILSKIENETGKLLNINLLKEDISNIEGYYRNKGYSLFRVINANLDKSNNLVIDASEGRISEVTWEGLKNIKEYVVKRSTRTQKGTVFNSIHLREDREVLLRLGYFSEIYAPILKESDDHTEVDIVFRVVEKKTNRIDLGLEFDQLDNQLLAFLKSDINHLLIHSDLMSGKFQVGLQEAQITDKNSFSLKYLQPWVFNWIPVAMEYRVWNEINQERLSDQTDSTFYQNRRNGGSLSFAVPLIRNRLKLITRGKMEDVRPDDSDLPATVQKYDTRSVSLGLAYSNLQNRFNPKKGGYWSVEMEKGGEVAGYSLGGLNYTRITLNTAYFMEMSKKSVMGFHLFMGGFQPDISNALTFESEVFSLGGTNSIRGFKDFNPIIGKREYLFNVEYRRDINNTLQFVLFYDIGQVFDTGFNISNDVSNNPDKPNALKTGYGAGIRFSTPLGPFRFDLAQGRYTILHFSLGQMF